MILTTQQQAHNFALWVIQNTSLFDDLNHEALVGGLKAEVCLVFGNHTFSEEVLEEIVEEAIAIYDQSYSELTTTFF